jgi:SET domain-containing protein
MNKRLCGAHCKKCEDCNNSLNGLRKLAASSGMKFQVVREVVAEKGLGVKTRVPIKAGSYIGEYLGVECANMSIEQMPIPQERHDFIMRVSEHYNIDASEKGSYFRYKNHSCDPNCRTEKW